MATISKAAANNGISAALRRRHQHQLSHRQPSLPNLRRRGSKRGFSAMAEQPASNIGGKRRNIWRNRSAWHGENEKRLALKRRLLPSAGKPAGMAESLSSRASGGGVKDHSAGNAEKLANEIGIWKAIH